MERIFTQLQQLQARYASSIGKQVGIEEIGREKIGERIGNLSGGFITYLFCTVS